MIQCYLLFITRTTNFVSAALLSFVLCQDKNINAIASTLACSKIQKTIFVLTTQCYGVFCGGFRRSHNSITIAGETVRSNGKIFSNSLNYCTPFSETKTQTQIHYRLSLQTRGYIIIRKHTQIQISEQYYYQITTVISFFISKRALKYKMCHIKLKKVKSYILYYQHCRSIQSIIK